MQISFNRNIYQNQPSQLNNRLCSVPRNSSPLAPLSCDTVSFGAMKKSQFDGINLATIEKFKAPIEKFNDEKDLQNWASDKVEEIANTDFGGRQEETKIQRKAMVKEWSDYLTKENDAYTPVMQLLALDAAVHDLKPNNDKLPPVLNKGVLADVMYNLNRELKTSPKQQFNLNKIYQTKLAATYLETTTNNDGNTFTGWVEIPSQEHDPENFDENVNKLKALSHPNWCTKSFNAEPYLAEGDFHVYLENGNPKLGVRFVKNEIQEIQGELNNGNIPLDYFDEANKHIKEGKLKLRFNAKKEIETAEEAKIQVDKAKNDLKTAIEMNDSKTIFEYFGIECKELENGMFEISHYEQPDDDFQFKDVGIDENKLFEKVEKVSNNAKFSGSQLTGLVNLKSIGGHAFFYNSQVTSLGKVESIGKNAYFSNSQVTDLGELEYIGENAHFNYSQVTDIGNLQSIGRYADFRYSQVISLGKLQSIGCDAYITNSKLKQDDFKNIELGGEIR